MLQERVGSLTIATMRGAWIILVLVGAVGCGRQEPFFVSVILPEDTTDTVGPYRIEAYVEAPNGVGRFLLRLANAPSSDIFSEIQFTPSDVDDEAAVWFVELPGRPAGTEFYYYLLLTDTHGALIRLPDTAPVALNVFRILESSP